MRTRRFAAIVIASATATIGPLVWSVTGASAAGTSTWRAAQKLPGAITLNKGGNALVQSVSCASTGNCSAGGYYKDGSGHLQAFVTSEVRGTWHTAIEVPGTATLNKGGNAQVLSLSCSSAGNCAAGGWYTDGSGNTQAYVVSQVNGTWHTAIEAPGTAGLNVKGDGETNSVSCATNGNCSAGGSYRDASYNNQAFVISEVNGTWRGARPVPGVVTLNVHGYASVTSVSCSSAGNCSAGGLYEGASYGTEPFVVRQVNGTWGAAHEVPGMAALDQNQGGSTVASLSCASAGNCSVGGSYGVSGGKQQVFVANEVNGTWRNAMEVPGTAALNTGGAAWMYEVSCGSPGNCVAGGSYFTTYGHAFVATEVNGSWHAAVQVPGTSALNTGKEAYVTSVSCASAGNCGVGGTYTDGAGNMQAFVASQVNGSWRSAIEVPGTGALNTGGEATIQSISCPAAGTCDAGGRYTGSSGHSQAFVVAER